jgi:membrane protein YqaA with SNARE-associated domain
MKKALALFALICIYFIVPLISGVSIPKSLEACDLGNFLGSVTKYWLDVIKYATEKVSHSCRG